MPTEVRLRSPPEIPFCSSALPIMVSAHWVNPNSVIMRLTRACKSASVFSRLSLNLAEKKSASRTVAVAWSESSWATKAMDCRTCIRVGSTVALFRRTSAWTCTLGGVLMFVLLPLVLARPLKTFNKLDLPDPEGPKMAVVCPAGTCPQTLSKMVLVVVFWEGSLLSLLGTFTVMLTFRHFNGRPCRGAKGLFFKAAPFSLGSPSS
mmetsp:Transcript_14204/g.27188  ORF Transcript_14204/g.27188 Transcript_14204/m.27188 type:complete len:206 (+) Transcript_14204:1605-2222(+)